MITHAILFLIGWGLGCLVFDGFIGKDYKRAWNTFIDALGAILFFTVILLANGYS